MVWVEVPVWRLQDGKKVSDTERIQVLNVLASDIKEIFREIYNGHEKFPINSLTHPGEKRLIQLCKKQCKILPENFEENLELLFSHMFSKENHLQCIEDIENIVRNVKKII